MAIKMMLRTKAVFRLALCLSVSACTDSHENFTATSDGSNVQNVADAAIAGGNVNMALNISRSVLARDPHNLDALYHEGAAYYAMGRCEDAIAAYQRALQSDPHSSQAQTGIGRCLIRRNALEAERAFTSAVADDPDNAAAQSDLGVARALGGDFNAP